MSLVSELNERGATPETVLTTLKGALSELEGDPGPEEMRARLAQAIGEAEVKRALSALESQPALVEEAALAWLAAQDSDPKARPIVEGALQSADNSLPLFETALVALVALYAIHAIARIPTRSTTRIVRGTDGSYRETTQTDYASFSEPLKGLLAIFSGVVKSGNEDGSDTSGRPDT